MKLKRITAPAVLPVLLDDIKDHLRIPFSDDSNDDLVESLLYSAIDHVENILNRKLISQTWEAYFDSWCELLRDSYGRGGRKAVVLPFGRIQSITHIKYTDENGDEQTVSTDYYALTHAGTDEARIVFDYDDDHSFEFPDLWEVDPVTVRFVCGYGDAASSVPYPVLSAIKLVCGDLFFDEDSTSTVYALLNSYRSWGPS